MERLSTRLLSHSPFAILESFGLPFLVFRSADAAIVPSSAMDEVLDRPALDEVRGCLSKYLRRQSAAIREPVPLPVWRSYPMRARSVSSDLGAMWVVMVGEQPSVPAHSEFALSGLTPREQVVARLIADGESNKRIAAVLMISEHTARHHTERVFAKLRVRSRAAVASILSGVTAMSIAGKH
jgi:DNA-binding CsgD family transcriptional regulator